MEFSLPCVSELNRQMGKEEEKNQKEGYCLMSCKLKEYANRSNPISFAYHLKSSYFTDILAEVAERSPDIITFQGVLVGHETLIAITGYESIFFNGKDRDTGYATLWKTGKFTLKNQLFVDFALESLMERSKFTAGLVLILHSIIEDHDVCIVNSETSLQKEHSEYQIYTLLHYAKKYASYWNTIILAGSYYQFESLMRSDNFSLSTSGRSLIQKLEFFQKGFQIECSLRENPERPSALSDLFKTSTSAGDFYHQGGIEIINTFCRADIPSIEFKLNYS